MTPQLGLRENWRQFSLLVGLAVAGLLGSLLVRDTRAHVALEAAQATPAGPALSFWGDVAAPQPGLRDAGGASQQPQ